MYSNDILKERFVLRPNSRYKRIMSSFFHVSPRFLNPEEASLYYLEFLKKFLDPFYLGIIHHSIIARGICLMSSNQLRANLKFEIGCFNTRGLHHLLFQAIS